MKKIVVLIDGTWNKYRSLVLYSTAARTISVRRLGLSFARGISFAPGQ
jgi:hypothetical protein